MYEITSCLLGVMFDQDSRFDFPSFFVVSVEVEIFNDVHLNV